MLQRPNFCRPDSLSELTAQRIPLTAGDGFCL
jgi:hypothetical protein